MIVNRILQGRVPLCLRLPFATSRAKSVHVIRCKYTDNQGISQMLSKIFHYFLNDVSNLYRYTVLYLPMTWFELPDRHILCADIPLTAAEATHDLIVGGKFIYKKSFRIYHNATKNYHNATF